MADFVIKKGDRLPALRIEFSDSRGPLDISGCSIVFNYRKKKNGTLVSRSVAIEDAVNGVAQYLWQEGDTNEVGVYLAEFIITFPDGRQLTFPADSFLIFEIVTEIA
jgi:hypothetical protein